MICARAVQTSISKHAKFTTIYMVHWLHRRGQQLLLAKVKNADWQDWYISIVQFNWEADRWKIRPKYTIDICRQMETSAEMLVMNTKYYAGDEHKVLALQSSCKRAPQVRCLLRRSKNIEKSKEKPELPVCTPESSYSPVQHQRENVNRSAMFQEKFPRKIIPAKFATHTCRTCGCV